MIRGVNRFLIPLRCRADLISSAEHAALFLNIETVRIYIHKQYVFISPLFVENGQIVRIVYSACIIDSQETLAMSVTDELLTFLCWISRFQLFRRPYMSDSNNFVELVRRFCFCNFLTDSKVIRRKSKSLARARGSNVRGSFVRDLFTAGLLLLLLHWYCSEI